ncbi:MAG TPA: hypothetical protein VIF62_37930, partial [Labilithrix sp.]
MRSWFFVAVVLLAACTDLGGLSGANDAPPDAGGPPPPPPPSSMDAGGDSALACTGGLTACGSACVDTQGDGKNCGRCDHDCLGGECKAGLCAPITLATGLNDPTGIAADAASLYVTVYGDNAIVQVAKVAGGSNTLSTSTTNPSSI